MRVSSNFICHRHVSNLTPYLMDTITANTFNLTLLMLTHSDNNGSELGMVEIENTTYINSNIPFSSAKDKTIETAFYVCVLATQIAIMLSMGSIITITEIIDHFKRPISICVALVSQFIIMPASTFGLINLAQFPPTLALSGMILATCPGGSSSNLFAHIFDGDVPLSIMLTTMSTVLAIGFMPLNLWIYTRQWEGGDQLKVPYKAIVITLAWILVPLIFGMIAKRFAPRLANWINQIGSVLGMALICIAIILQYIMFPEAFNKGWKLWLMAAAIPTAGFLLGYLLAFIARQPAKQCKTISLETGMQSISLAATIVVISFPVEMHGQMTPLLTMCGAYTNVFPLILFTIYRICCGIIKRKSAKPVQTENSEEMSNFIS